MRLIDADALLEQIDTEREILVQDGRLGAEHILVHYVREFIEDAPFANPYKIVLEDLRQVPMFTGMFDAKNGNKYFMFGVLAVLEYIADKAGDEEYIDMFLDNMNKSVYGDKAVATT